MTQDEQFKAYQAMAHAAAVATKSSDAGVAIIASYDVRGSQFVIWGAAVCGGTTYHYLDCASTDEARLIAHLAGFVENHLAAWARIGGAA
jgi:hypothetical protein